MLHLDIGARQAELRQRLFQIIGEKRNTQQVGGRAFVVGLRGLVAYFVPIADRSVATPEP